MFDIYDPRVCQDGHTFFAARATISFESQNDVSVDFKCKACDAYKTIYGREAREYFERELMKLWT